MDVGTLVFIQEAVGLLGELQVRVRSKDTNLGHVVHLTKGGIKMDATQQLRDLPDVLYIKEAAPVLRMTERALRHHIDRGNVKPVTRVGGRILVPKATILKILGIEAESAPKPEPVRALPAWRQRRRA